MGHTGLLGSMEEHFHIEDGAHRFVPGVTAPSSHLWGHGLFRESSLLVPQAKELGLPTLRTETRLTATLKPPQRCEGTVVTSHLGNVAWQFRGQQAALRVDVGRK